MAESEDRPADKPQDAAQRLDAALESAQEKGRRIAGIGLAVAKAGQEMADVAGATRNLVHIVKTPPNIESLVAGWENADTAAGIVLAKLDDANIPAFLAGTSATISASSDTLRYKPSLLKIVPIEYHPQLESAASDLSRVLERSADEEEVKRLMTSLGLDKAPRGRRAPMSCLRPRTRYMKPP